MRMRRGLEHVARAGIKVRAPSTWRGTGKIRSRSNKRGSALRSLSLSSGESLRTRRQRVPAVSAIAWQRATRQRRLARSPGGLPGGLSKHSNANGGLAPLTQRSLLSPYPHNIFHKEPNKNLHSKVHSKVADKEGVQQLEHPRFLPESVIVVVVRGHLCLLQFLLPLVINPLSSGYQLRFILPHHRNECRFCRLHLLLLAFSQVWLFADSVD